MYLFIVVFTEKYFVIKYGSIPLLTQNVCRLVCYTGNNNLFFNTNAADLYKKHLTPDAKELRSRELLLKLMMYSSMCF